MIQVMVTHISNGGGAGQDRITENVTLNFRKFTQIYTPQDDKGNAKPKSEFTWDIAAASE
jgi:type VI secretion system secreted protein Hcp